MKYLLLVAALTFQGDAQSKPALASWDDLRQIARGKEIRATIADGKALQGHFQSATQDSLALTTPKGLESLDRTQVLRVQVKRERHRLRNSLIGLGVGACAGLGIGAVIDQPATCNGFCIQFPKLGKAIVTPIGAILGVGTGALIPTGEWKDVYRAR